MSYSLVGTGHTWPYLKCVAQWKFTWVTVFLALTRLQQVLQNHMRKIAENASSDQWAAAATAFRVPYWDWGMGARGGPVPNFFMTDSIDVVRPDGSNNTISNPLYSYQFHPLEDGDFDGKVSVAANLEDMID